MVTQKLRKLKPYTVVLSLVAFAILYYFFSFLVPFTNNAFVVANVRPVAAIVSGYITDLYVKNEQYVQKGEGSTRLCVERPKLVQSSRA